MQFKNQVIKVSNLGKTKILKGNKLNIFIYIIKLFTPRTLHNLIKYSRFERNNKDLAEIVEKYLDNSKSIESFNIFKTENIFLEESGLDLFRDKNFLNLVSEAFRIEYNEMINENK